jgi:hypothetical protein
MKDGELPKRVDIESDVKTVWINQTMSIFQQKMEEAGVDDYLMRSINAKAHVTGIRPRRYGNILKSEIKWIANVTGTVTIEYDDIPIAIGVIIAALAAFLAAHPVIIVVGLGAIIMLIGVLVMNATLVNLGTQVSKVIETSGVALKTATSTWGGAVTVIILALIIAACAVFTAVALVPDFGRWLSRKFNDGWRNVKHAISRSRY